MSQMEFLYAIQARNLLGMLDSLLFLSSSTGNPVLSLPSNMFSISLTMSLATIHFWNTINVCVEHSKGILRDFYLQPWPGTLPCSQIYSKNNSRYEVFTDKAQVRSVQIPEMASHITQSKSQSLNNGLQSTTCPGLLCLSDSASFCAPSPTPFQPHQCLCWSSHTVAHFCINTLL